MAAMRARLLGLRAYGLAERFLDGFRGLHRPRRLLTVLVPEHLRHSGARGRHDGETQLGHELGARSVVRCRVDMALQSGVERQRHTLSGAPLLVF